MAEPLTQKHLKELQCQHPDCTHEGHEQFYLHAKCHIAGGTFACYDMRDGTLTIECATCHRPIAKFQVAP